MRQDYQQAVQVWRGANEAALEARQPVDDLAQQATTPKRWGALVEQEKQTLQAWQTGKLGISMQTAPAIGDCDKLFAGLGSLP
jgi:hypothetical protein